MARSDRFESRRKLGFESLETKTSPSAVIPFVSWTDAPAIAGMTRDADAAAYRFLQQITNLDDISIERATPSEGEARAADKMIVEIRPD